MFFSERYGYRKLSEDILWENMPDYLKRRIWNVFDEHIFRQIDSLSHLKKITDLVKDFIHVFWEKFLKGEMSQIRYEDPRILVDYLKDIYLKFAWYDVYDFIEFFANNFHDKDTTSLVLDGINTVLTEEQAPYKINNGKVIPLVAEEEISEIEKALNISDKFKPAREHLSKALDKWADRKNPDYENSIKESICAIESLIMTLEGEKKELSKLIDKLNIHPALKEGFKKIYGWTSDENGVRHAVYDEPLSCGEAEARYMLITCSAFVNYIVAKNI